MEFKVFQNGNVAGNWSEDKVKLAMEDKNNVSVGRSSDDLVIVDERDEWHVSDYYKTNKEEVKMTVKEMYTRKNEIVAIFEEAGRTVVNGKYTNIKAVTNKDGVWTYDLQKPIITKVINAIRKKNGLSEDTFVAYGQKALDNAIEKGLTKKAANITKINAVIKKNVDKVLDADYGYLVELQKEFFGIIDEMKANKAKMDDLDLDVEVDGDDDDYDFDLSAL